MFYVDKKENHLWAYIVTNKNDKGKKLPSIGCRQETFDSRFFGIDSILVQQTTFPLLEYHKSR